MLINAKSTFYITLNADNDSLPWNETILITAPKCAAACHTSLCLFSPLPPISFFFWFRTGKNLMTSLNYFILTYTGPCIIVIVEVVLQPATRIPPQPSHTETLTHIETRTHDQCGDSIEKSQAPDDRCINVQNMLSIEKVK